MVPGGKQGKAQCMVTGHGNQVEGKCAALCSHASQQVSKAKWDNHTGKNPAKATAFSGLGGDTETVCFQMCTQDLAIPAATHAAIAVLGHQNTQGCRIQMNVEMFRAYLVFMEWVRTIPEVRPFFHTNTYYRIPFCVLLYAAVMS